MFQFPVHMGNRSFNGETTSVWSQESMVSLESREMSISAGDVVRRLNQSLVADNGTFKVSFVFKSVRLKYGYGIWNSLIMKILRRLQ